MEYTGYSRQLTAQNPEQRKIYRVRQPVVGLNGNSGYLDFWTPSETRALEEAGKSSERILQPIFEDDIQKLSPAVQLKAQAVWDAKFSDD